MALRSDSVSDRDTVSDHDSVSDRVSVSRPTTAVGGMVAGDSNAAHARTAAGASDFDPAHQPQSSGTNFLIG